MSMVKVQTAELIGPALDWAVATALGHVVKRILFSEFWMSPDNKSCLESVEQWRPSEDWLQCGNLVDAHVTALNKTGHAEWWAHSGNHIGEGPAPLIAACRAIVAAKLGDSVEVPQELLK